MDDPLPLPLPPPLHPPQDVLNKDADRAETIRNIPDYEAHRCWAHVHEIEHVEFTIRGYSGVKKAIFLPPGMLGSPETAKIVLDHWKLSKANILLEIGDSGVNPKDFLTDEFIDHVVDMDPRGVIARYQPMERDELSVSSPPKSAKRWNLWPAAESIKASTISRQSDADPGASERSCVKDPSETQQELVDTAEALQAIGLELCESTDRVQQDVRREAQPVNKAAFHIGSRVRCRNHGTDWVSGVVTSQLPLMVRPDGRGYSSKWDEVEGEVEACCEDVRSEFRQQRKKLLNDLLHERVVRILGSVAVALESSNSWFLTRPGTYVSGNHILVEQGMLHADAAPVVFVLDDPFPSEQSFEKHGKHGIYTDKMARQYEKNMIHSKMLLAHAKKLKTSLGDPVELRFDEGPLNKKDRSVHWCFGSGTHYLFAPDCSKFQPLFFATMPPGLFACGGDYEDGGLSAAQTTRVNQDCPARKKILYAMERQLPVVLMKYTTVAHDFSYLIEELQKKRSTKKPPVLSEPEIIDIWQKMYQASKCHDENSRCLVRLSDAFRMNDLHNLFPKLFKETVVVVDPMSESPPEEVLKRLSGCFSSLGRPDIGAGDADKDVVGSAWLQHQFFHANAEQQKRLDVFFLNLTLFVTVLGLASAIIVTYVDRHNLYKDENQSTTISKVVDWRLWPYFKYIVVLIQAVSTLLNTYVLSRKHNMRWANLNLAGAQLVSEVYKFRSHVGPYALHSDAEHMASKSIPKTDRTDKSQALIGLDHIQRFSNLSKRARMLFTQRVQHLVGVVMEGEMASYGVQHEDTQTGRYLGDYAIGLKEDEDSRRLKEDEASRIMDHVQKNVNHIEVQGSGTCCRCPLLQMCRASLKYIVCPFERPCQCCCSRQVTPEGHSGTRDRSNAHNHQSTVDLENNVRSTEEVLGPITTESYVNNRIVPILKYYRLKARSLSLRLNALQLMFLVLEGVATVMAAVDAVTWVPIVISLGTAVKTLMEHFRFQQRLSAMNVAVSSLSKTLIQWKSFGILDRQVYSTRDQMISSTEDTILMVTCTSCGILPNTQNMAVETQPNSEQDTRKNV